MLFISHDLAVVKHFSDRVAVMYAGQIVETADAVPLFEKPMHPYTEALMKSMPGAHARGEELYAIPGLPPDLNKAIEGCPFAPRCAYAEDSCRTGAFPLLEAGPDRESACAVWVKNGREERVLQ